MNYEQELEQIISEIEISSPASFTFEGKTIAVKETSMTASTLATSVPLVVELQTMLYQHCYCRRWKQQVSSAAIPAVSAPDGEFLAQLSQANASQPRWDTDWRVRRVENNGQIWAEKAGVVRVLLPGEYMNFNGPGVPLKAAGSVTIFVAKESTTLQPGLYFAFSETIMPSDHLDIARFYWNIDSDGVVELLRLISRDMNRFQVPFQFKGSIYRHGYDRRDAAVLYVQRKFFPIAKELASGWAQACGTHLRDDVPLFTLRLEKGVGLAEDPGTGESFGMNRCRHVADALLAAHVAGVPRQHQSRELKRHFQKHGLDLNRPYLNPGSVDRYRVQASA